MLWYLHNCCLVSGARFTNDSWTHNWNLVKIHFALILNLMLQSDHSFALAMRVQFTVVACVNYDLVIVIPIKATFLYFEWNYKHINCKIMLMQDVLACKNYSLMGLLSFRWNQRFLPNWVPTLKTACKMDCWGFVSPTKYVADASLSANGSTAFKRKLCCHWLNGFTTASNHFRKTTKNQTFSRWQLFCHWWHCSLSSWQPAMPPRTTNLALRQIFFFSDMAQMMDMWRNNLQFNIRKPAPICLRFDQPMR